MRTIFQSTLPAWGATPAPMRAEPSARFQSTLPAWGATSSAAFSSCCASISIHAPRVGSDLAHDNTHPFVLNFNPRSPRGERQGRAAELQRRQHFNPRSPRGERRRTSSLSAPVIVFQSTLPAWGATSQHASFYETCLISIHAPRVGSDPRAENLVPRAVFQSTLPAWGATMDVRFNRLDRIFQSTLPAWGATNRYKAVYRDFMISIHAPRVGSDHYHRRGRADREISIHAPRVGSDSGASRMSPVSFVFQSTLPAWGATRSRIRALASSNFNPRSPRGERRSTSVILTSPPAFQSTLPAWGATRSASQQASSNAFQSTLPAWGATTICADSQMPA